MGMNLAGVYLEILRMNPGETRTIEANESFDLIINPTANLTILGVLKNWLRGGTSIYSYTLTADGNKVTVICSSG